MAARSRGSLATELVPPATPAAPPPDAAAYQSLLKGRYYWRKTADSGVMQALSYYEEALALDQTFASAHAGVARVHILRARVLPRDAAAGAGEGAGGG